MEINFSERKDTNAYFCSLAFILDLVREKKAPMIDVE